MSKEEIRDSFVDYSSLVGSNVGIILLSFISVPILVRLLGVSDYGRLNLFFMVCQIGMMFISRWSSAAVVRFGKEEFIRENRINETFWARAAISLPIYAVIAIVCFIFRNALAGYIGLKESLAPWLIIVYVGCFWFVDNCHSISKATRKMRLYAWMEILERVIFLILLGLAFFALIKINLTFVILYYIIGMVFVALYFLYQNRVSFLYPVEFKRDLVSEVFKFSAPLFVVSASAMAIGWMDIFVIKLFSSVESVGLYSLSYKLMSYLQMFSTHAATVILPILIAFHVAKDNRRIREYINRFMPQITYIWSFLMSAGMIAMAFSFGFIFGKDFEPALNSLLILMLGLSPYILFSLHRPLMHVYKITGRIFFITVIAMVLNFLLDFILVPRMGINGAAVATAVSFTAMAAMQVRIIFGYLKIVDIKQFLPLSIACLTFLLLMLLKRDFISGLLLITLVLAFSLVLAKKAGIFRKSDIMLLEKIDMPLGIKRMARGLITVLA